MKKLFIIVSLFLFAGLFLSMFIDLKAQDNNTVEANQIIVKYVIGSGGILGSGGPNYLHSATVGETVTGGMQNGNNLLLSGFWNMGYGEPTGVEQKENIIVPSTFELHQNYPNPFNPQTTIEYDLPEESIVSIEIFNLVGQKIRTLLIPTNQSQGYWKIIWDGCNDQNRLMGSGVYLYRITILSVKSENRLTDILFQKTKKMLFVK